MNAGVLWPARLIELWQANAAGRYHHVKDDHPAPLDPNFTGAGRTITDADGRYQFTTIKPGAYPWRNHDNAWRPAHIHFSLFGSTFRTRLVTQMYFPDDPLLAFDPMFQSIRDERARRSVSISRFDLVAHAAGVGARLLVRHRRCAGPTRRRSRSAYERGDGVATASQTVGPFFHLGLKPQPARQADAGHRVRST